MEIVIPKEETITPIIKEQHTYYIIAGAFAEQSKMQIDCLQKLSNLEL